MGARSVAASLSHRLVWLRTREGHRICARVCRVRAWVSQAVTSSLAGAIAHRHCVFTAEPLCGVGGFDCTLNRGGKSIGAFSISSA